MFHIVSAGLPMGAVVSSFKRLNWNPKKGLFVILSTIRIDSSGCVREWHICDVDVFHVTPKSGGEIIGRHFYNFIGGKESYLYSFTKRLQNHEYYWGVWVRHYRLQSQMLMRTTTILGFQPLWLADCLPHHLADVLRLDCLDGGLEGWLWEASC